MTAPSSELTQSDRERSATASGMSALLDAIAPLRSAGVERMLDVGCGYGGIARAVASELGASAIHGIDIDAAVIAEAGEKGVLVQRVDVESEPLPFPDESIDFTLSLGMLDYLPTFDGVLTEMNRVLPPGGHILLSIPNLGSWHNRLALLLGYQPRDVEISDRAVVGALPHYRNDPPAGHLHTATLRAFEALMTLHGFRPTRITGAGWLTRETPRLAAKVDQLFCRWPSLARRYFYLGTKVQSALTSERAGWWAGRESLRTDQKTSA